jgi:two-component system NtrC family sensor kinase
MEEILIIDDSKQICSMLAEYVLPELGYTSAIANTGRQGLSRLRQHLPDLILLDLQLPDISGLDLLRMIAQEGFDVPVILMTAHGSEAIAVEAFRLGARNYLIKPFSENEAQIAIDNTLRERRLAREKDQLTRNLRQRVQELTVLYSIGKSVSSLLDLEEVLVRIVEAGVYITRAEEGFLLLRDDHADELYLRAAKNLGEQRAQRLRMPINDSIAGQVVKTGKPIRMDRTTQNGPLKIKTGFLVRSILQVPLTVGNTVLGVLAVDNQQSERPFTENDQYLLSALADYAAIAIENARLYQQVKTSEERYRDLFTNAYDFILTLDRDLRITSTNKVGPELTGYPTEELIGKSLEVMTQPEAWAIAYPRFGELLAGRSIAPIELRLNRRDGEMITIELSARLVPDPSGELSIHAIARNMTERRRLEEQLLHSEKLSAIGQLVAGVAHELNNPLTSISGFTQLLLRDEKLPTQVREDLGHIGTQAERAGRIVQNLLVFAREHKPQRIQTDLNEVLRSTLALRAYQLRVDNIRVNLDLDPQLPQTTVDPFQIQQVFLNLINNSHQAMVERGESGMLTLRSGVVPASVSADGRTIPSLVRVVVEDTGVGIARANLRKIFDPFYTTKPVGQGTGLGLSICFGIVQEHGGRIWADSDVGAGTRMYVDLPILRDGEANDPLPIDGQDTAAAASIRCRALVVDDEEPVAKLLARLMSDLGHEPTVATNGVAALELIANQPFDLVLTDVKMPEMNGFELFQAIRERNPNLASRVVFVTGDLLTAATQARLSQLGNPYLPKPFSIDQLESTVRALLTQYPLETVR